VVYGSRLITSEDFNSNFVDALHQTLLTGQAAKWFIEVQATASSFSKLFILIKKKLRSTDKATKEFEHLVVNIKMQRAVQQHAEKKQFT